MKNNTMGTIETSQSEGMRDSEDYAIEDEKEASPGLLSAKKRTEEIVKGSKSRQEEDEEASSDGSCESGKSSKRKKKKTPMRDRIVLINKIPEIKFDFIEENANLAGKITDINKIAVFCRNVEADNKHIEYKIKTERESDP